MNDEVLNSSFARYHQITPQMAERYAEGRWARRAGQALPHSRLITPEESWYRAGYHDQDMESGNSVIEGAE